MTDVMPVNPEFLDRCAMITEAYDRIMGGWELDSQLLHIITEVAEFKDVLRNKQDKKTGKFKYGKPLSPEWYEKFYDELADIHLTVFSTDNFLNNLEYDGVKIDVSAEKLNQAINKKLEIVYQRVLELQNIADGSRK